MESFTFVKVENEDNITELLACRVCLETDSRLVDLYKNGLADLFREVTGTPISKMDGLPQHICLICYSLLHKSAAFRTKCRKVHMLLHDALLQQTLMTTTYIKTLDRTHLKLPLSCKITFSDEYPQQSSKKNCIIKKEPSIKSSDDEISNDWDMTNDSMNYEFVVIPETNVEPITIENTEDINTNNDEFLDNFDDLNTREPEEKRVTRSSKKVKKSLPKKNSEKKEKIHKETGEKVKRPFNRKYEEDFAGFSESYNCEVVFYTKEQQLREVEERKESSEFKKARFKCTICYKGFMNVSAHEKHMTTHDKASGEHICDVCFARFPVRRILMNHLRTHKNRFICKICDHVSKVSTLAKAHYKWHEGFKYECKECNKQFNTMSTHLNHKRQYHASVTCEVCKQTVSGTKGLDEHNEKVHSSAKFPCATCKKQFDSQEAFNRHLSPGCVCIQTNCPCTKCGESFQSKQLLYDHRETAHGEILFRCDECPEAYTTGRMLASHWTFRHAKSSFMCEVCARSYKVCNCYRQCPEAYTTGRMLASHWTFRHAKSSFMCEVCARSYKSASALKTHQRVHAGDRPQQSPREFCIEDSLQGKLRNNQRIESADRPFQCPMCPKRFRQKTNLKVHINTHTGERPYKCTQCDDAFKSYSQKYKHSLMVHKKERRYKCHMCEKAYVVSFDLKMHIRTFHMKIPRPPPNRRKNRSNKVT